MSQLITINLSKGPGTAWGFRLQGGKDFAQPLCIQKVNVGSVAEAAGLRAGDAIVSIGSSDALALRHKEAQDAIVKAGSSFQMVVQRGAMTWKPQVTALAQPKKTPEGPVATQTSLAATGKQQAKSSPRLNIGSSYNNSPRPFPGPGTWASSPLQSPQPLCTTSLHSIKPLPALDLSADSSQYHSSRSRSISKSYSTRNGSELLEDLSEMRSLNQSRGPLRGLSPSPMRYRPDGDGASVTSRSSFSRLTLNESHNQFLQDTNNSFKEPCKSPFNESSKIMTGSTNTFTGHNNSGSLYRASYVSLDSSDCRNFSPPLPPPPPLTDPRTPSPLSYSTCGVTIHSTPAPYNYSNNNSVNVASTNTSTRSNRSPSPYYNSTSSRTPRSLSPSCSIPSMPSSSSVPSLLRASVSSVPLPSTVPHQQVDPVADLELKNSLKIEGADIELDKENARNFLRMQLQLEKEKGKDYSGLYIPAGGRKATSTRGKREILDETKQNSVNNNRSSSSLRTKKLSQDSYSPQHVRDQPDPASSINTSLKSYFMAKSTENLPSNCVNANNNCSCAGFVLSTNTNGSNRNNPSAVCDNIKLFNDERRHSSFTPPKVNKLDFKSRTLDRSASNNPNTNFRSNTLDHIKKFNSLSRNENSNNYNNRVTPVGVYMKKTLSCIDLTTTNSSSNTNTVTTRGDTIGGSEVNCNVPWKNHFTNLRRRSAATGAVAARATERSCDGADVRIC